MLRTSLFGLVSGLGGEEEELGRRTDELPWGQVHLQLFVYLPKKTVSTVSTILQTTGVSHVALAKTTSLNFPLNSIGT